MTKTSIELKPGLKIKEQFSGDKTFIILDLYTHKSCGYAMIQYNNGERTIKTIDDINKCREKGHMVSVHSYEMDDSLKLTLDINHQLHKLEQAQEAVNNAYKKVIEEQK